VERFLAGSLAFTAQARLVEEAVARFGRTHAPGLDELEAIDAEVRDWSRLAVIGGGQVD
jgi:1-deoxy-D-xylulose 5-phosphate reductoisomerase